MSSAFPPGRGSELTPDERRDVQRLRLVDGASISEIARRTGRNRETIANIVRSDDTRELAQQLESESREAALRVLRVNAEQAARAWATTAIKEAAAKGDHRPARDLLLHAKVISPLTDQQPIGVQVIVGTTQHPAGPDPFETITITPRRDE